MKIKELFKKIENANEIIKLSGDYAEYRVYVIIDYDLKSFTKYKSFMKYMNTFYFPEFVEQVNKLEFRNDEEMKINDTAIRFSIEIIK